VLVGSNAAWFTVPLISGLMPRQTSAAPYWFVIDPLLTATRRALIFVPADASEWIPRFFAGFLPPRRYACLNAAIFRNIRAAFAGGACAPPGESPATRARPPWRAGLDPARLPGFLSCVREPERGRHLLLRRGQHPRKHRQVNAIIMFTSPPGAGRPGKWDRSRYRQPNSMGRR